MLDLNQQYASIREEIQDALAGVYQSQHFILGPQVEALEKEIAAYCGTRYAAGLASGTDALILAMKACEIGPGDEVIVPAFTFFASAGAVSLLGATPVFADIQRETFTLDPAQLESKITSRTRAIMPVHLYGQAADMEPIIEIARRHRLRVIEDNAQAIGATYHGRRTGSLGDVGCISFYPTKNLGAWGDGGMVVTNSEEISARIHKLRNYGFVRKYVSEEIGWNSRLDEIQAAVLRVKLRHLDRWNRARADYASIYDSLLKKIKGLVAPKRADWGTHVFHQYTVRLPKRDLVQKYLAERSIGSTVYYPVPLHLQPAYKDLRYQPGDLPASEQAAAEVLSLPMYPELTQQQIQYVAAAVESAGRG